MTDLMTYASAYRRSSDSSSASSSHPHIMTRGKQFEVEPSDGVQYCIAPGRRTGNPPKRAASSASSGGSTGGGRYAKKRAAAYARTGSNGGQPVMEHAQAAFASANWRDYGAGAAVIEPMSRGAITNIQTDHEPREIPKYATPVRNVTFAPLLRGSAHSVASPVFELRPASSSASSSASIAPFSDGGGASDRYARPFCAERFTNSGGGGASSPPVYFSTNGKAGGGGRAARTYASSSSTTNEDEEEDEDYAGYNMDAAPGEVAVATPQVGHVPGSVASIVSAPETAMLGHEPFGNNNHHSNNSGEGGDLPMYWYGASPSASSLNVAPWDRHAPARLLSDWNHGAAGERERGYDVANNYYNSNEDDDANNSTLRFLTQRVNSLARQLEKNQVDRIDNATEEWLASAVLGLFVICVVDALRNK